MEVKARVKPGNRYGFGMGSNEGKVVRVDESELALNGHCLELVEDLPPAEVTSPPEEALPAVESPAPKRARK
jgi:hypothetical protein